MNRSFLTVGAGLALALGVAGCDNDKLTRLNENPNNPQDVPPEPLFTNAVRSAVNRWLGGGYSLRGAEFVVQHLAEIQYPDEDRYRRLGPADTRTYFDNAYINELEDFETVIRKGEEAQAPGIYGPALVMRTWVFSYLTDTFGDIPYFDALKASPSSGPETLTPKYDAQKEIYDDFFLILDKAATDMEGADGPTLGSSDPIYGGNLVAWQRFANSLRARLALRLVNVDPATASRELAAAFAAPGGVFESNADNALLRWPGNGIYDSPWAANFKTRDDHRVSKVLIEELRRLSDPRVRVWAMLPTKAAAAGDPLVSEYCLPGEPLCYTGAQNAMRDNDAFGRVGSTSRPGAIFYPGATAYGFFGGTGQSFPSFLMTYAEVALIAAEAKERALGGPAAGTAASWYAEGIRASMEQWGITDPTVVASYLAGPGVAYVGGVAGQKQIAIQKWLALFTDGGTAWAEWRRTCQPATIKPGPTATQANVPRRFRYSPTEYSVNMTGLQVALERQGTDAFATRVYWDTEPQDAPTFVAGCGAR